MKQSSKTTMLKLKSTTLTNEKINETHRIHDAKLKTFIISKFLLLNKTQIEKFNHFSTNSIAIDTSNEKKFTFKNSLKLSKVINFTKQSSKTITLKIEITILINEKINKTHRMHDAKIKTFIILKFSSSNKTQIEKFNYFSADSIAINALNEKKFTFKN